jgi:dihydrofolate reductase
VIYRTATSLNGFISDSENSLGWLFAVDQEGGPEHAVFLAEVGVLVSGSTTYEWVLEHTDVLARPAQWQEFYGQRPMFVFTSRKLPCPAGADVRFVSGVVQDWLPAIVEAAGERDVWLVGGGELVGQFADIGVLDRIELTIAPVALAAGAPLLPRHLASDRVRLVSAEQRGQFAEVAFEVTRPS